MIPSDRVRLDTLIQQWEEQIAELKQLLDAPTPDAYIYARRRSECDTLEMCVAELRAVLLALGDDGGSRLRPKEPTL